MATKRKDKSRVVLKTGEVQRKDGTYQFSWQDSQMKRRFVYARTLDDLREKEKRIQKDKCDGIKTEARYTTIDELFDLWANMKRGLKNNTFENYKYMYNTFVRPVIGSKRISTLKKSDIKKYYNYLVDERNLKPSTIDNIHTVLHQVLQIAVDDDFIRNNPSDNVLRELKKAHCFQSEKRRALTKPEQELFLNFLKTHPVYEHWYPVFAVMIGTGLRVGEVTGLRWCDIDMESGMIDVNHTLVYYDHRTEGSKSGCYFNVNTTKTPASMRQVPMLGFVREAFEQEKQKQEDLGLHCEVTIDGYTDFIFINRFGQAQHQATLNKAILGKGCRICEQEYLSVFPAFALSYYSHMKGLKIELGSDRVLGIPLDTYIPSEQVAIEVNSGSEDMEILKEHLCQQRGIKRIKLPMKTNETEIAYAQRIKAAFQSVHIFITSDTEEDVGTIRNVFENWRNSQ